jgi:hypothetical protein
MGSRLTKYTMSKRAQELLARQIETARTLHPVAVQFADLLQAAIGTTAPDSPERERIEYTLRQVEDIFAPGRPAAYADMTEAEVRRVLEALNLFEPGMEVYRLIVNGVVVKTFLAKNRHHAANHVRKHDGIEAVAYRYAGRHEVHAVKPVVEPLPAWPVREELVTVCGDCEREVRPCAACERGEATQASPHVHHECAPMHRRNAQAQARA